MKFALLFTHDKCRLFQITKITYFPFCVSFCLSEVAPYLRGGGVGQQVVLEGNRLVLTCLAGGSWPLQYRWTLNNSNITDWTPQYRSVSTNWLLMYLTLCHVPLCYLYFCLPVYVSYPFFPVHFFLSLFPSLLQTVFCVFSHACSMEKQLQHKSCAR